MKRFFKLTLVIGILMIALAISNIVYADDFDILTPGNLNPSESTSTSTTTQTTTQTTTTKTTLDLTTKTTKTTSAKTTSTTLPHTGIEDNTGAIVAIIALAVVGISSFVVIKKNSDI